MAKFKTALPAVNLSSNKGGHSHLVVELDGTNFKEGVGGDTVMSVEDKGNGVSFAVSKPTPKKSRMSMKIRNKAKVLKAKDRDLTGGTLTVTLTVNTVTTCVMIPVNYVTEENPCECP